MIHHLFHNMLMWLISHFPSLQIAVGDFSTHMKVYLIGSTIYTLLCFILTTLNSSGVWSDGIHLDNKRMVILFIISPLPGLVVFTLLSMLGDMFFFVGGIMYIVVMGGTGVTHDDNTHGPMNYITFCIIKAMEEYELPIHRRKLALQRYNKLLKFKLD